MSALPQDVHELAAMLEDATEEALGSLLGASRVMARVRDVIARVAPGPATVLVRGETGTGKELVARAIHDASSRSTRPMVVVHCAALPDALLESELFGHDKGAFTGADRARQGRVELAEGGTLFLDEIGDVTSAMQVKLLRLLQGRTYERLGTARPIKADVRFVAATHRDLESMVKAGTFREDLFYRLNVVPLWVPPLRARPGDVALLASHFCARFGSESGRVLRLSQAALDALARHRWPGNVRQLQNVVERLVVLSTSELIDATEVECELSGASVFLTDAGLVDEPAAGDGLDLLRRAAATAVTARPDDDVRPLAEQIKQAERTAVTHALRVADGNRSKAARLLGVSRQTLYVKMREHELG